MILKTKFFSADVLFIYHQVAIGIFTALVAVSAFFMVVVDFNKQKCSCHKQKQQ